MQFLFNLLRIKGLYVFRGLLAHPQEVLYKRQTATGLEFHSNPFRSSTPILLAAKWHNMHAIYQVPFVEHLLRMNK
jgi:hypothetical protein